MADTENLLVNNSPGKGDARASNSPLSSAHNSNASMNQTVVSQDLLPNDPKLDINKIAEQG